MKPVVLALASNEAYFPGLYCAVTSALNHLGTARTVDLKVLDGGISDRSRKVLSDFVGRTGRKVRFEFVPINESVFRCATLGPGRSYMTYCRTLLPRLLDVPKLIYLDSDVLVFRDLTELFDIELRPGQILAAVPDSETLTLGDDSQKLAAEMKLSAGAAYFNAGVMLLNLDELRRENFTEKSLEFFRRWRGDYRFWDQSAFNFLLHEKIEELPEFWNRAAWRFDEQEGNSLDCVLHYTTSAPWLGGTARPSQVLFERFAAEVGFHVDRHTAAFKKRRRQQSFRSALAPFRALAFSLVSLFYKIAGEKQKCAAYQKASRYWLGYILNAPRRLRLHNRRAEQIQHMKFKLAAFKTVA